MLPKSTASGRLVCKSQRGVSTCIFHSPIYSFTKRHFEWRVVFLGLWKGTSLTHKKKLFSLVVHLIFTQLNSSCEAKTVSIGATTIKKKITANTKTLDATHWDCPTTFSIVWCSLVNICLLINYTRCNHGSTEQLRGFTVCWLHIAVTNKKSNFSQPLN